VIQKSEIIVVVPAYNEAATVSSVVTGIIAAGFSCIVVDDGSTDSTSSIAKKAGANVLSLPFNVGVGGALRCGFRYAIAHEFKAILQCDADGQHMSHHFLDLLSAANETEADLVLGSRFLSSENRHNPVRVRKFAMGILAFIASKANGTTITDATSGFRLIKRPLLDELAENMPEYYLGDTFETLVVIGKAEYKVVEIATAMAPRQSGVSSAGSAVSVLGICKSLTALFVGLHFKIRPKSLNTPKTEK
jgi:glycosyltransferase involved in cell wall biosynthesis